MEVVRFTTNEGPLWAYAGHFTGKIGPDIAPGTWQQLKCVKKSTHHRSGIYRFIFTFQEVSPDDFQPGDRLESISPPGLENPPEPIEDTSPEDPATVTRCSYHEAGHAVLWFLRGFGIERIVIGDPMSFVDPRETAGATPRNRAEAALAGGIAQKMFTGVEPLPHHIGDDQMNARQWLGNDEDEYQRVEQEVQELIRANWAAVHAIAKRLITLKRYKGTREMLTEEAEQILREHIPGGDL